MKKSPVNGKTLLIDTPTLPPSWALLERELIRVQTLACQEFFNRYFDLASKRAFFAFHNY